MTIPATALPSLFDLARSAVVAPSTGRAWACDAAADVRLYERGSVALAAAVQSVIDRHRSRSVTTWLPELMCEEPLEWLQAFGFDVAFYRVTETLEPDWSDVDAGMTSDRLHVLVIVHYFGFPNPGLSRAVELSRSRNVVVVEDAAHVLAPCRGVAAGSHVVYSPRKLLAVPWVGCLVTNGETGAPVPHGHRRGSAEWLFRRMAQRMLRAAHINWHQRWPDHNEESSPASVLAAWHGSAPFARRLLALAERQIDIIRVQRRSNYRKLGEYITRTRIFRPLFSELADDVCPFAFPMRVTAPVNAVLRAFRSAGVPASRWPDLPRELRSDESPFPNAKRLSGNLVLLPVHQGLSPSDITIVGERVIAIDDEFGSDSASQQRT